MWLPTCPVCTLPLAKCQLGPQPSAGWAVKIMDGCSSWRVELIKAVPSQNVPKLQQRYSSDMSHKTSKRPRWNSQNEDEYFVLVTQAVENQRSSVLISYGAGKENMRTNAYQISGKMQVGVNTSKYWSCKLKRIEEWSFQLELKNVSLSQDFMNSALLSIHLEIKGRLRVVEK